MRRPQRGFSLLETFVALILVAVAMTALILAFANSGQYGVLSRRQATALAVGRSLVEQLNRAPWTDTRLLNNNTGNDATFADPNGVFASSTVPSGANAPDTTVGSVTVGTETYTVYINISPQNDTDDLGVSSMNGLNIAAIVCYRVGSKYVRAVALGYRYNPNNLAIPTVMPL
jgi:prepilin-type N-terminal cleavage/methylation domain-containing protein